MIVHVDSVRSKEKAVPRSKKAFYGICGYDKFGDKTVDGPWDCSRLRSFESEFVDRIVQTLKRSPEWETTRSIVLRVDYFASTDGSLLLHGIKVLPFADFYVTDGSTGRSSTKAKGLKMLGLYFGMQLLSQWNCAD